MLILGNRVTIRRRVTRVREVTQRFLVGTVTSGARDRHLRRGRTLVWWRIDGPRVWVRISNVALVEGRHGSLSVLEGETRDLKSGELFRGKNSYRRVLVWYGARCLQVPKGNPAVVDLEIMTKIRKQEGY